MAFSWLCLALIILPNLGGWIGGIAVGYNTDWYKHLNIDPIIPPDWLFGAAWTIIYCMMGFASYLVWEQKEKSWIPITIYAVQLVLNWRWSGMHTQLPGLFEVILLDVAVVVCILTFGIVRFGAGALLLPYAAWMALATYLTYCDYAHHQSGSIEIEG